MSFVMFTHPPSPPTLKDALKRLEKLGRQGRRQLFSKLTARILAVNVLALAILGGGLLYLGRYQDRLIQNQLDAMKAEARLVGNALAEATVATDEEDYYVLAPDMARQMVRRLAEVSGARMRLFSDDGILLADSRRLTGPGGAIQIEPLPPRKPPRSMLDRFMRKAEQRISGFPGHKHLPPQPPEPNRMAQNWPDAAQALQGEADAHAWVSPSGRLVLSAGAPVQRFKQVLGAVLLTRDGSTIDAALRSVRLDILRMFGITLAVTVLLSLYLASAISKPIRRLAAAADRIRRGQGRRVEIPDFTKRRDEIGDLSGALREMTNALWARMDAIERFAADVAHELKNPLTSIRSALETLERVEDVQRRQKLLALVQDDILRMDRLITDISQASRIDAEMSRMEEEPLDLAALLQTLADIHAETAAESGGNTARVVFDMPEKTPLFVAGKESRLVQVIQNLISNAISFSPSGGTVRVTTRHKGKFVEISVEDEGPGIPEQKLEAIFERFYTQRPTNEKFGTHSGLGLSISKQIVLAHKGEIFAQNIHDESGAIKGARFIIHLPALA